MAEAVQQKVYGICIMAKMPKMLLVWILFFLFVIPAKMQALTIENTADNPRLVNLTIKQYKTLEIMEKRLYNKTFDNDNNLDRIERLELDYFDTIRKGTVTQRINSLKIESGRTAIRGTAMTPMMMDTFNSRYINQHPDMYHDDVGIIDGLVRLWWPDFYAKVTEYRKFKESNFYQYN